MAVKVGVKEDDSQGGLVVSPEVASSNGEAVQPKKKAPKKTPSGGTFEVDTVKGIVTIKHADGSETIEELPVKEVLVTKKLLNVGMSAAMTFNLGNYESAKVNVSLHVPCESEELEDTYEFISNWVNGKMTKISDEIKGN